MYTHIMKHGYVIVRGQLDTKEAVQVMETLFPADKKDPVQDFGNSGEGEFPCHPELNKMTVHPVLIDLAQQCLGTKQIRLTQSVAWAKYGIPEDGSQSNRDQRVHMDYGNNYWGVTSEKTDMIAAIVYYSDTEKTGGATAIVPKILRTNDSIYQRPFTHMPGIGGIPFINNRQEAEKMMHESYADSASVRDECYDREIVPTFKPGDILLYRMDTWHRGTPVKDNQVRYIQNLTWRREDAEGIQQWNPGFTRKMYYGDLERFISSIEPYQLETLGFPKRDSPLWTKSSYCKGVRARYSSFGFDLDKYIQISDEPPSVPQFWHFSFVTFEGNNAHKLRENIFEKLSSSDFSIQIRNSKWVWDLEYCEGPNYITVGCYIFKRGVDDYILELNLLSGERFTWGRLVSKIRDQVVLRYMPTFEPVQKTHESFVNMLDRKEYQNIYPDMFHLIGQDRSPDDLMYFLDNGNTNTVRAALLRLTQFDTMPEHLEKIKKWTLLAPTCFLNKEIIQHAHEILTKHSCL